MPLDTRSVELNICKSELRFLDVASSIIPESVHVRSLNHPENIAVLEQNYEYDLVNPARLLDKYVGKKIKIIDWNKFQDRKDVVDAILLGNDKGAI